MAENITWLLCQYFPPQKKKKVGRLYEKTEHLSKGLIIYLNIWVHLELTKLNQKVLARLFSIMY